MIRTLLQTLIVLVHGLVLPSSAHGGEASLTIERNGFVYTDSQYPYLGHRYEFDRQPGDNDMPWLRNYSEGQGIMDGVDMSADWKHREFEMMKSIIHHTSYNLSWTAQSTVQTTRRAKDVLEIHLAHPDYSWGCGHVAAAAVGLAQAHGIPARFVNGRKSTPNYGGDYCVEFHSTTYNRWIWFCPKTYSWIEHEELGPLGMRELTAHDEISPIMSQRIDGQWIAIPNPPLVFQAAMVNAAPIAPHFSIKWWHDYWSAFAVSYKTQPNGNYPACCDNPRFRYACNSELFNELYEIAHGSPSSLPVVSPDSLDINYPLNNVEASAQLNGNQAEITLVHNMPDFIDYEIAVMEGCMAYDEPASIDWRPIDLATSVELVPKYLWTVDLPARLWIRGTGTGGVHSPDVVISYLPVNPELIDSDGDGVPDHEDVCPCGPIGLPVDAEGRPRSDLNGDCRVDALDIQVLIDDLLSQP